MQVTTAEEFVMAPSLERGPVGKMGSSRLQSTYSAPSYKKSYPQGSSSAVIGSVPTQPFQIELGKEGYFCPWVGNEARLNFTITNNTVDGGGNGVDVWVEPLFSIEKFDFYINNVVLTDRYTTPRVATRSEIYSTPLEILKQEGPVMGLDIDGSAGPGIPVAAANISAVLAGGIYRSQFIPAGESRTFSIPLKYIGDNLLCDNDSLLPLWNMQARIDIAFAAAQTWSWSGGGGDTTLTISGISLEYTQIKIESEANKRLAEILMQGRYSMHTIAKVTSVLDVPATTAGSQNHNVVIHGLPQSVRYVDSFFESSSVINSTDYGYKGLTSVDNGLLSFRYFLGNTPLSDEPVEVNNNEAFWQYLNCRLSRMKTIGDTQREPGCGMLCPAIFSGYNTHTNAYLMRGGYPDVSEVGSSKLFSRGFVMSQNLGSVNTDAYSGNTGSSMMLQLAFGPDRAVAAYDAGAGTYSPIPDCRLASVLYSNMQVILGPGTCRKIL